MGQQKPLVKPLGRLGLPQHERSFPLCKLIAGSVCGCRIGGCRQHPLCAGWVVHSQQRAGFQLRRLINEDAVGIPLGKPTQRCLGCRIIARLVIDARGEKIRVVGQLLARLPRLAEARDRIGVALVQQVRVAQCEISRRRGLACVPMRILGHARISRRSAQRGQLLGHGAQLGRSHKGQLDPRRPRPPHRPARLLMVPAGPLAGRMGRGLRAGFGRRACGLRRRLRLLPGLGRRLRWRFVRLGGSRAGWCRCLRTSRSRRRQRHHQQRKQNNHPAGSRPRNRNWGRNGPHILTLSCFRTARCNRVPLPLPQRP